MNAELYELLKNNSVCKTMLYEYGFHDTRFQSLSVSEEQAVFEFEEGVYRLDEVCRETTLTGKCRLRLTFYPSTSADSPRATNSFDIYASRFSRKKKYRMIEIKEFLKYLKKDPFEIFLWFYTTFDDMICFKGRVGENQIEITIHEVSKAEIELIEKY